MPKIKAELSPRNPYRLSKHRQYELMHFCLQYPEWKRSLANLEMRVSCSYGPEKGPKMDRPLEELVIKRDGYRRLIEMVENAAKATDDQIGKYILKAVTEGLSFETVKMRYSVPCERDMWYDRWRKFYWVLDRVRR